jgi:hypothetical protein
MSVDLPSPLTILIIRHAEKHGEIWPGPGLTREGKEDDKSLVIRGWERAGAWAALFGTLFGAAAYPKPSAIYAANPEAVSLDETSQRPFQTVIPLSERLGLTPITSYSVGQEVQLVSEVLHSSEIVLISETSDRRRKARLDRRCTRNLVAADARAPSPALEKSAPNFARVTGRAESGYQTLLGGLRLSWRSCLWG